MSPDFARLLEDPAKAVELPPEAIPPLLTQLAALQTALAGRLLSTSVGGNSQPVPPTEDRLLTAEQVADRLQIPKGRVYELVRRGGLPAAHIGKYVRIPAAELQGWVAQRRQKMVDTPPAKPHRTRRGRR